MHMLISNSRRHITGKNFLEFRAESFLNESTNSTTLLRVGFREVFSGPRFQVDSGLRPWVLRARSNSVQLCESNSECHIIHVVFCDDIISGDWNRRQLQ